MLESAGVLDTIDIGDMIMLNGVDAGRVAPRLFCDICDRFDLHDTEDCPTQAMQIDVSFQNFFSLTSGSFVKS